MGFQVTPAPLEKKIETDILLWLNTSFPDQCFAWKNNSIGVWDPVKKIFRKPKSKFLINGVADIIGIYKGKFLAIEVKRRGNKASLDQERFLERIRDAGGIAFVACSVKEVEEHLSKLDL